MLPGAADLMCFPSLASPETQTGTGTVTGTGQTEIVTVTVVVTVPAKRAAAAAVAVGGAVRIIYLLGMVSCPLLVVLGCTSQKLIDVYITYLFLYSAANAEDFFQ